MRRVSRNNRSERRCPTCEGAGELTIAHPSRDPQLEEPVACPQEGCVHGWIRWRDHDPLWVMRQNREISNPGRRRVDAFRRERYAQARKAAMAPARLPSDAWADPLFRQAQRDTEAAIVAGRSIDQMFSAIFGRAA